MKAKVQTHPSLTIAVCRMLVPRRPHLHPLVIVGSHELHLLSKTVFPLLRDCRRMTIGLLFRTLVLRILILGFPLLILELRHLTIVVVSPHLTIGSRNLFLWKFVVN